MNRCPPAGKADRRSDTHRRACCCSGCCRRPPRFRIDCSLSDRVQSGAPGDSRLGSTASRTPHRRRPLRRSGRMSRRSSVLPATTGMRSVSKNPSPTLFRLARLSSFHGRPGKFTRPLFPPPESNRVATGLTLRTPGSLASLLAHPIDIRSHALDRVSGPRGTHGRVGQVFAVESDIDPFQVLERSAQKPGRHQRGQAQRDLDRDQQPRQAQAAAHHRSRLRFEGVAEVRRARRARPARGQRETRSGSRAHRCIPAPAGRDGGRMRCSHRGPSETADGSTAQARIPTPVRRRLPAPPGLRSRSDAAGTAAFVPAPSARRTADSRCLPTERDSSRFATLAHTISSSTPTSSIRIHRALASAGSAHRSRGARQGDQFGDLAGAVADQHVPEQPGDLCPRGRFRHSRFQPANLTDPPVPIVFRPRRGAVLTRLEGNFHRERRVDVGPDCRP